MKKYIITDGTRFIHRNSSNKFVPTLRADLAVKMDKYKADNVYRMLPKPLRKCFRVEKVCDSSDESDFCGNIDVGDYETVENIVSRLYTMNGLISDIDNRIGKLEENLSEIDMCIVDIEHYIENSNLNAADGYKAYRMLKDKRMVRRKIKNEMEILDLIRANPILDKVVEDINNKMDEINNRPYKPRIMTELFDSK